MQSKRKPDFNLAAIESGLPNLPAPGVFSFDGFLKRKKPREVIPPSAFSDTAVHDQDFTTSTGQGAWPMTLSVTLPMSSLLSPVLP